jgi:transposase InsO family protein
MARDGVAVDSRLAAAVAAKARGEELAVAAGCARIGVSRQTFYKYLARFRAEGVEGLFPRSRAALRHPARTGPAIEDAVLRARKELDEDGADNGALSIRWRLEAELGASSTPSRATIHRILVRRGQVAAQPRKAPRSSSRRFEAAAPNQMWQMDAFEHSLADGQKAVVIQVEDDCTRLDLADLAAVSESGASAWAAVQTAIGRYGLPRQMLTDNKSCLNGSRRGFSSDLEDRLRALGVTPISSTPRHPQTTGKNERVHQTLQRWLARRPAADLTGLQELLEAYRDWYNRRRRHQSLGGLTPQQRWDLADKTGPDRRPVPPPPAITHPTVSPRGAVGVDGHEIGLAKRHAGARATVFRTGDHVTVFIGAHHVRTLDIDRSRRYQPSGLNPRTGQPRPGV